MTDPVALLRQTTAVVATVVDAEPNPASETPCPDWDAGQLLTHLVGSDRALLDRLDPAAAGSAGPVAADRPTPEEYRRVTDRLVDLLARPEVLAGSHELPVGRLPGTTVVLLRSVEHLLHGWDLARAAGVSTRPLDDPAAALAEPAQALLAALAPNLAGRSPFAAPVSVSQDADPVDRLVAAFGRDPGWLPDVAAGYARLQERFADRPDVEVPDGSRRGFGADGMRVAGRVFACTYEGRLMLKLPSDAVSTLIDDGRGLPLAKPGQRPMREWALVPLDDAAAGHAEQAYAFATRTAG